MEVDAPKKVGWGCWSWGLIDRANRLPHQGLYVSKLNLQFSLPPVMLKRAKQLFYKKVRTTVGWGSRAEVRLGLVRACCPPGRAGEQLDRCYAVALGLSSKKKEG